MIDKAEKETTRGWPDRTQPGKVREGEHKKVRTEEIRKGGEML